MVPSFIATLVFIGLSFVKCEQGCILWENNQETSSNLEKVKFTCTVKECVAVSCQGRILDYKGTMDARIQHCNKPISLIITITVPQENLNWSDTFYGSRIVPIPDRQEMTIKSDSQLEIIFQRIDDANVTLGVSVRKKGFPPVIPVVKKQTVVLPSCSSNPKTGGNTNKGERSGGGDTNCSVMLIHSCDKNEICEQIQVTNPQGICKCRPHYIRNEQGNCEVEPTVPSSNASATEEPNKSSDNGSRKAVIIVVPIVMVIVFVAVVAYMTYRFRWMHRIRARLRQPRTYEEMVIEGDDSNDSQSHSMGNPIA